MKRILMLLCVLLLTGGGTVLAAGGSPLEEGLVQGHGSPETMFYGAVRPSETQLRTTAAGLQFLKDHEGFRSGSYGDYSQTSIGYGTSTGYAAKYGFPADTITEAEAHELLVCVVYEMEQALNAFLEDYGISVSGAQYDALVSFTYNNGAGWLRPGYRISNLLISGGYTRNEFASAMGIWCHVTKDGQSVILEGLVNRRKDEIVLFLDGAYSQTASELTFCTLEYTGEGEFENDIDFFLAGEPYGAFSAVTPVNSAAPWFHGWYTENGARIRESTIVTEDLTVHPLWGTAPLAEAYTIDSLRVLDESGQALASIPGGGFYLEAAVYKASDAGEAVVLLATYTGAGKLLDTWFLRANVPGGTTYSLGVWIANRDGQVGKAKAFLFPSLSDPTPLCGAAETTP